MVRGKKWERICKDGWVGGGRGECPLAGQWDGGTDVITSVFCIASPVPHESNPDLAFLNLKPLLVSFEWPNCAARGYYETVQCFASKMPEIVFTFTFIFLRCRSQDVHAKF